SDSGWRAPAPRMIERSGGGPAYRGDAGPRPEIGRDSSPRVREAPVREAPVHPEPAREARAMREAPASHAPAHAAPIAPRPAQAPPPRRDR
ncbi:MAG: hypothetical protein WCC53_03565, partial [Thermoanaerobaculia bacterium]